MRAVLPVVILITTFAQLKNSNLLPDPGKQNPPGPTDDNQLIELESVDSTNNYAMGRIHEGLASDGLVCLARHQWAGKGQRGKTWLDEPRQNLMMSLILEPAPLILSQQFLFSAAVALAILDQLRSFEKEGWTIKWPNDIYWNDRKAAGILIESVIQGKNWLFAVVGIGMNLNQESFPPEIPNAVSLKQITGNHAEPVSIALELRTLIQNRIARLKKEPHQVLSSFNQSLYKKNQIVSIKKGADTLLTRLTGVDAQGFLLTENGSFTVGEVQLAVDS
jgi:BirA family transcriptional regulator, biotin operon repressor / biotin---[acetyl-CoA-carboxylase] ligase